MIRVVRFRDGRLTRGGAELIEGLPVTEGWLWVDLYSADEQEFGLLWRKFDDIPQAARFDFEDVNSQPLFDRHDAEVSVWSLKGLDAVSDDIGFNTIPIGFMIRDRVLLTRHGDESKSIDYVMSQLDTAIPKTALELGLAVCQRVFDRYMPIVRRLESRLEEVDDLVFQQPSDSHLAELTNYKMRLRRLRRFLAYHTQAFALMAHEHGSNMNAAEKWSLKGVQDTVDRLNALSGTFYDMCGDLIDGYISLASHRMNQIMKVLTMVTVVFVPLGFMAGIYGMNFETMPELAFKYSYFILLGFMATIAGTILFIFYRKHWF